MKPIITEFPVEKLIKMMEEKLDSKNECHNEYHKGFLDAIDYAKEISEIAIKEWLKERY